MGTPDTSIVDSVETRVYDVPTDQPEADGTAAWDATTTVVVLVRSGSVTGMGWTYGPSACAAIVDGTLADVIVGTDPMSIPSASAAMIRAVRNATRDGVAGYAVSAVDVALWDLKARLLDKPLADVLGRARASVPIYGSGGFTTYDDRRLEQQLSGWVHDDGIPRVKIKIGESWGTCVARDVERIDRARQVIGPDVELYVDANGAYQAKQAIRLAPSLRNADVTWFEEPVSSDDLAGLRLVRRAIDADVTAGEYGGDLAYFQRMCAAEAVDCLQIDATRCGGYTEWLRAASVAAASNLEVSAHCAPNLHASVAAAAPNLRHVEWFHDHVRLERLLFHNTLDPSGGSITPDRGRPGHGMELRSDLGDAVVRRQ